MLTVYGLKNCDSCRKALTWLDEANISYGFLDVRVDGLEEDRVTDWIAAVGLKVLVNRRSTTWRNLGEGERAVATGDQAASFLTSHPALIKRPVFEFDGDILVGINGDTKELLQQISAST